MVLTLAGPSNGTCDGILNAERERSAWQLRWRLYPPVPSSFHWFVHGARRRSPSILSCTLHEATLPIGVPIFNRLIRFCITSFDGAKLHPH